MNDHKKIELQQIVKEAGAVLMDKWPGADIDRGGKELEQMTKSDGSLVTEADFAANEILVSGVQRLFPDDGILSEELPADKALQSMDRVWIIDPLDGTTHFAQGQDDFSVLIGLCERGAMTYGIMYFPAREQFITGEKGFATVCNGVEVRASSERVARSGRVYIRNFEACADAAKLANTEGLDSGMALMGVCSGELDGAIIRMTTHQEWDIAAPTVVIEGSGGRVTDEQGRALTFNRGDIDLKYFVASNGLVHDQLLEIIAGSESQSSTISK